MSTYRQTDRQTDTQTDVRTSSYNHSAVDEIEERGDKFIAPIGRNDMPSPLN